MKRMTSTQARVLKMLARPGWYLKITATCVFTCNAKDHPREIVWNERTAIGLVRRKYIEAQVPGSSGAADVYNITPLGIVAAREWKP